MPHLFPHVPVITSEVHGECIGEGISICIAVLCYIVVLLEYIVVMLSIVVYVLLGLYYYRAIWYYTILR